MTNIGIDKIDGLCMEEWHDKLFKEGVLKWTSLTKGIKTWTVSCEYLLNLYKRLFELLAFNFSDPCAKEEIKVILTKHKWLGSSKRQGLMYEKKKGTDAYEEVILMMHNLHEWYWIIWRYLQGNILNDEILNCVSHLDALLFDDYRNEYSRINKKRFEEKYNNK